MAAANGSYRQSCRSSDSGTRRGPVRKMRPKLNTRSCGTSLKHHTSCRRFAHWAYRSSAVLAQTVHQPRRTRPTGPARKLAAAASAEELKDWQNHAPLHILYVHPVLSTGAEMDRQEWIARCSARLRTQWPTVPAEQLTEVAAEIQLRVQQQLENPQCAAVEWLRQGMPTAESRSDAG